ncbi:glycosyltransferase family 2 protein [Phaeovulum sp.]|uniref:glycosyltransferase family 2 protein n=1 Tax=Phaeovulum sp. TaxID=2934796 RepID=UPI0035683C7E
MSGAASPQPQGVSCIIPAYNEAARIGGVLAAVAGHPEIAEVIVVDDASQDGTAEAAAAAPGVRLIRLPQNRGKTFALAEGIEAAAQPLLLLLDADLLGLTAAAISALIAPVRDGRAEVSISLRQNAPRLWQMIGLDYISGERVLPRAQLAGRTDALRGLPRFGFEVHLNTIWIGAGSPLAVVRWDGVQSPYKGAKMGVWPGMRADAAMLGDIMRTISPLDALAQIRALRRLRLS